MPFIILGGTIIMGQFENLPRNNLAIANTQPLERRVSMSNGNSQGRRAQPITWSSQIVSEDREFVPRDPPRLPNYNSRELRPSETTSAPYNLHTQPDTTTSTYMTFR